MEGDGGGRVGGQHTEYRGGELPAGLVGHRHTRNGRNRNGGCQRDRDTGLTVALLVGGEQVTLASLHVSTTLTGTGIVKLLGQGGGHGEHTAFPVEYEGHVGGVPIPFCHNGRGLTVSPLDLGDIMGKILIDLAGGNLNRICSGLGRRGGGGFGGVGRVRGGILWGGAGRQQGQRGEKKGDYAKRMFHDVISF